MALFEVDVLRAVGQIFPKVLHGVGERNAFSMTSYDLQQVSRNTDVTGGLITFVAIIDKVAAASCPGCVE